MLVYMSRASRSMLRQVFLRIMNGDAQWLEEDYSANAIQPHAAMEIGGLLHWPDALARTVFFAKVNLFLVVASVTTTSLFYLSLR